MDAFHDFKNKHQKSMKSCFLICKSIYILKIYPILRNIVLFIHWDIMQTLEKFPLDKINVKNKSTIFFRELQLITVLLLIRNSYTSWSARFISLKHCVKTFHFRFRLVLIKTYIFVQFKAWTLSLWNVKIPFKIKVTEKLPTVLLPDLWFLSCNKNFENSMISVWVGAPQKLPWRCTF